MRLGLGSYSFRWALGTPSFTPPEPASLADLVREAGELGVQVLQVADSPELEAATAPELARLREAAAGVGVHWQIGFTGATPERLEHFLAAAVALEADVARIVIHDSSDTSPEISAIADHAQSYEQAGVTLGIENHFSTTSPRLIEVVESIGSPAVGVVLDVANSIMCGEWPHETIALLAPHTVCLHLKDYRLESDVDGVGGHVVGTPLGTGLTDPDAVFAALRGLDPSLAVIVEQWSPRCDSVEATLEVERRWRQTSVATAAAWLRKERAS
ncbi:sugar phosphate isomerase/epimerase [Saccharomonospora sp. NPDC046836]|uniref:sugar phosphate isomerase/epimerase family protein n=1 Tax=Saccharomonospora sp. NPDC046836 TaxID=3156921 RepID=UPI0033C2985F